MLFSAQNFSQAHPVQIYLQRHMYQNVLSPAEGCMQAAAGSKITHIPWDFHAHAKQRGSHILTQIVPIIDKCLHASGLFVLAPCATATDASAPRSADSTWVVLSACFYCVPLTSQLCLHSLLDLTWQTWLLHHGTMLQLHITLLFQFNPSKHL